MRISDWSSDVCSSDLYRNASGQGLEILRIDADGGVQVRSPSETARGDYGIYDLNSRIITLIGSVSLNRGDTQVRGQRLVMDLNTGRSTLDGGNVASPDGGRGSGRFVDRKSVVSGTRGAGRVDLGGSRIIKT